MRNTIEFLPKDGQFVIVEDASGNDGVARWSSETETWVDLYGEPTGICPTHWWPIPAGGDAPSSEPPLRPAFTFPRLNTTTMSPVFAGHGDWQPSVLPLRGTPTVGSRRRRSFPLFTVALLGCVALAVLTASFFRGEPMNDFRNILAWLHSFDSRSAAAQPSRPQRVTEVVGSPQALRPIDTYASLKAAMEKVAAERRASEGELAQQAVLEAARANKALEQKRESAQAAILEAARASQVLEQKRESAQHAVPEAARVSQAPEQKRESAQAHDVVTGDLAALGSSAADAASEAQLARSIGAPALSYPTAGREPDTAAETAKLLERASGLLRQGDIGGARLVLAFAHEMGSARAGFMLAETYDPLVLSTWTALGTRADPAMARELYAKAYAAGIGEAKGRLDALPN